ncbi:MAG: calcium-binding EGF-like domain-containing protein, partial [Caldilineaceae bacterium]
MKYEMSRNRWFLMVIACVLVTLAVVLGTPIVMGRALAQDTDVFLPVMRDGNGQVREEIPTATPTSGPTATASPTPTMTPPPQPTLDPGAVAFSGGSCADGFHLMHESGALGIQDPDTFNEGGDGVLEPAAGHAFWDGYYCVPDDDLSDASCSGHGSAHLLEGVAACACETGYVGAQCNVCAPGYVANQEGDSCVEAPDDTPGIVVRGADDSIARDEVVELSASSVAPQDASTAAVNANTRWEIEHGYGCLLPTRDATECLDTVEGSNVFFKAPPGDGLNETGLRVTTFDDGGGVIDIGGATVMAQPPGYIPINGWGKPELQPILDQMLSFMKTRCVGAAVLGVAYYGKPVGVWGLGKTYGRASSTIFDDACGPDEADPHYPAAPNMGNQMGIMIGSVSKTVTFATARWALKDALDLWDKDVDLVAMNTSKLV